MKNLILVAFQNKLIRKTAVTAYFLFWLSQFFTVNAYAYIDPATTSMVIQIVAGVFISIGFALGIFRRKVVMFFKNLWVKFMAKKIGGETKERH